MIEYETRVNETLEPPVASARQAVQRFAKRRVSPSPSSSSAISGSSTKSFLQSEPVTGAGATHLESDLRSYIDNQVAKLPQSTCNPFKDNLVLTKLELLEIVICGILLMPIRLVAIFLLFSIKFICTFIMTVTYGKENLDEKPMTGWRLFIRTHVLRRLCKVTVFACGFHRVKINGKRADKDECRIIVAAPHTTFMDSLVFFVLDLPIVVMARMTIFSYIARGAQAIIVKRRKAGHGKRKLEPIIARSDPSTSWPQLLIFPEGTTTNGSCLISFKSGAFLPARPVQPLIIKYGKSLEVPSWDRPLWSFIKLGFLTLARFNNKMEITFLPVYNPNEHEMKDANLFGNNVRQKFADHLKIKTTEHAFEDCRLMIKSRKLMMPFKTGLIEFNAFRQIFNIKYKECHDLLEEYGAFANKPDGLMNIHQFGAYLNLSVTPLTVKLFSLYDHDNDGDISFRDFLSGHLALQSYMSQKDQTNLVYAMFSSSHDGAITYTDMHAFLNVKLSMPADKVDKLFAEISGKNDAMKTKDELKTFIQKHPELSAMLLLYHEGSM